MRIVLKRLRTFYTILLIVGMNKKEYRDGIPNFFQSVEHFGTESTIIFLRITISSRTYKQGRQQWQYY